ncbi:hypothetical protein CL655_02630 [bacterium]|nr:hypothetical protein [bacterium]|tara:strand:- start:181 stop:1284 length:1104 start_codon:yes stop_codon:yes gene_type:complete
MTILIFLAVLFVLILVHEWGHFITAKKTGMQVDEFGIGFPPRLVAKRMGETEYTLNLLPIGGFVRIVGENAEDIAKGEEGSSNPRSFVHKPKWAQALVLVAGVAMNVIFAWLLYVVVFMVGVPTVVDEQMATDAAVLTVTSVLPGSPAADAGLVVGAEVTGVVRGEDTLDTLTPTAFQTFITDAGTDSVTLTYAANGVDLVTSLAPEPGLIKEEPERAVVGVSVGLVEVQSSGLVSALGQALVTTKDTLMAVTIGLGSLLAGIFSGSADLSQVAGPVGIAGMVGDAAALGFTSLLLFTAIISLNLAVINLLPFPALDGGRLVMVGIEALTRRPINPVWVMRVNAIGFILLILLMMAVTVSDVTRLVG